MNNLTKSTSFLVLIFFLLFATLGCESCTDTTSTTSSVEFKNKDNTVYVRLPAEPDRLNPLITTNAYARYIYANIFQELVSFDPNTLKEVPILVKSRPIMETVEGGPNDGLISYSYELLEEASWSDGQTITAKDIIFTFKTIFNLNIAQAAPHLPGYFFVKDIVADPNDDKKFTVFSKEAYFLAETTINGTVILPAHVFDPENLMGQYPIADVIENGEQLAEAADMKAFAELFTSAPYSRAKDKLIGSGPYLMETWTEGQSITLSKNDNWWGGETHPHLAAHPDSLVYRVIPDQATAINALKDELIDVSTQIDATDFTNLKENEFVSQHYNFHTPDTYAFYYIALNNKDPKLEDKRVRRAIAHLVNLDFLIDDQFKGLASKMNNTPVNPSKSYFDTNLKPIEFNIEKARELLAEAGWVDSNNNGIVDKEKDGALVELELDYLVTPGSKFGAAMSSLLKSDAAEVGIQVNIVQKEIRALLQEDVATRRYHMFGLGAGAAPTPDDFTQLWHTSSNTPRGGNRVQFGNAESDAIIDQIKVTLDEGERDKLYKQFQQIIYDEQPMVFLFVPKERILISKRFDATTTTLRPGIRVNNFKLRK